MSRREEKTEAAAEHNALDERLDALFDRAESDGVDVPSEQEQQVSRVLIERMKQTYENTLIQCKLEMRVANRLKDEQMKTQIRTNAKRCVEALDELAEAEKELGDA